jgi:excinuclease UvrABC nuclease subunit
MISVVVGVCQKLISPQDYRETLQKVAMIFQGRTGELLEKLNARMLEASENLDFEQAATIRDQIAQITGLNTDQKVSLPDDTVSLERIALAKGRAGLLQYNYFRYVPVVWWDVWDFLPIVSQQTREKSCKKS